MQRGNADTGLGLRLTLVATLGGLLFGYDTAVISGAVQSIDLDFIAPLGLSETWRDTLSGLTISSALFGCILGSAIAGALADRFGRRPSLMLAAILFVISAIGSAWPEAGLSAFGTTGPAALGALIFYRLLCGTGIGLASMVSPLYIAEIAPKERRGQLITLNQMAIVTGIVGVYFVNYLIARSGDDAWVNRIGWRLMLGSEGVPALVFLMLLRQVPDTPRWLVLKGRDGEALALLKRLSSEVVASETLAEIRDSLHVVSASLLTYGWPVILLGLGLAVFQQFVGINAVLYYAPLMFANLGAGNESALLQTVIVGGANMLATIVALFTVDRLGRKPLLIAGSILMTVPMLGLGFLFQIKSQGVLALVCIVIYIIGFAISWGPVVWVVLAEVFPAAIRGRALALAVAVEWIANLVVSWSFKVLDGNSALNLMFNHGFAYYLYGVMSILSGIFVWRLLPETVGRSLDKMQELWVERVPATPSPPAMRLQPER